MRIISGLYRGLRLRSVKGTHLRPTSDQMRETLFDVLGPAIGGARFLDLYAGSGAVGLEALSRGAGQVVVVEKHRPAVEVIERNLQNVGASSEVRVMTCQAATGVERLAGEGVQFEYVFIDPPYAEIGEYHRALRQLGRSGLLSPSSVVIAEHSRHVKLEEHYGPLTLFRSLRHGDSELSFYRLNTIRTRT